MVYRGFTLNDSRNHLFSAITSSFIFLLWLYYMLGYFVKKKIISQSIIAKKHLRHYAIAGVTAMFAFGLLTSPVLSSNSNLGKLARDYSEGNASRNLWIIQNAYDRLFDDSVNRMEVVNGNMLPTHILPLSIYGHEHDSPYYYPFTFGVDVLWVEDLGDMAFRVVSTPEPDYTSAESAQIGNTMITSLNINERRILDVIGYLPTGADGSYIDTSQMQLVFSNSDSSSARNYSVPVYPPVMIDPTGENRDFRDRGFMTSISLDDLTDGQYDVSLKFIDSSTTYNFLQGWLIINDGEGEFVPIST